MIRLMIQVSWTQDVQVLSFGIQVVGTSIVLRHVQEGEYSSFLCLHI